MRLPIDAELLPFDENKSEDSLDIDSLVDDLLMSREKAFSTAKCNIDEAQVKQKRDV